MTIFLQTLKKELAAFVVPRERRINLRLILWDQNQDSRFSKYIQNANIAILGVMTLKQNSNYSCILKLPDFFSYWILW